MHPLIINPRRSTRSRTAESIDGDPGKDLVVSPGVHVALVVQFFVYPGEQCYRAGVEGVGWGLGFGAWFVGGGCSLAGISWGLAKRPREGGST